MRYLMVSLFMLMVITKSASAEPYIGFGVGAAFYKADLSTFGAGEFKENSTGTKLYGGYSFNKYFAAEATIYNFAEMSQVKYLKAVSVK